MTIGGVFASAICCAALAGPSPNALPVDASSAFRMLLSEAGARSPEVLRVWVFFTDKGFQSELDKQQALAACEASLTPRARHRRLLRRTSPGLVDERDIPVAQGYLDAVAATGVKRRHVSCWLNAVSVEADGEQVRALAALPIVRRVQPVARATRPVPTEQPLPSEPQPRGGAAWYNRSYNQLQQINIPSVHDAGFTGSGIVIGILDTGFNRTHEAFNQTTNGAHPVQIMAEHDFVDNDGDTSQQPGDPDDQSTHGTWILGTIGAYYPTMLVGAAFDASFILGKTEILPVEIPAEEDNYVAGLEWEESLGADLVTSSLGYIDWYTQADLNGHTAVTTIAVNTATDNGMPCCTAAGNGGHDDDPQTLSLIAPADALRVLTCGAVNGMGNITSFSSDGPTADGRVKPEVLARGSGTATVAVGNDTEYAGVSGTSLSTPLVAGSVALIVQAHPNWTVDKIRRALFHTASDFEMNATYDPLFVRGYGVIDVGAAIAFVHGDIDGDGHADGRDIQPFANALLGMNGDPIQRRRADCDASGQVNGDDVSIFVADLLGG